MYIIFYNISETTGNICELKNELVITPSVSETALATPEGNSGEILHLKT